MSYQLPAKNFVIDPTGPIPYLTVNTNQNPLHFHIQVQSGGTWEMVIDENGRKVVSTCAGDWGALFTAENAYSGDGPIREAR
jgi:hypothetical protein